MNAKLKENYINEVKYQTKMINRLKQWLSYSIISSSISLILILFGTQVHPIIHILGFILMAISIICALLIGLGIKNGTDNVNKIIDLIS
ncbi:MAG: hypothetical protein LUH02_07550 [Erysipelotrichaceae bacterium]|nr:hypothetical protein [Erysipelotrichaceae bacterium]